MKRKKYEMFFDTKHLEAMQSHLAAKYPFRYHLDALGDGSHYMLQLQSHAVYKDCLKHLTELQNEDR